VSSPALGTYQRLLRYLLPHRGVFILGLLGGVLFSATMVSFAPFAKYFFDGAFVHLDKKVIVWAPIGLVVLFALRGLGDFTQTYCMGFVSRHIVKRLRCEIFARYLRLPLSFYDRSSSGVLLSRLTYNTEQIGQATTDSVTLLLRETLTIIGSIGFLLWLNPRLALLALTMGPLVAWLVSIINRYFRRYSRRIQDSMGDVTRVAKETLEAPRAIKIYTAESYQGQQFEAVNERNRRSHMRLILTRGLANPVVQMVTALGLSVVLSMAVSQAIANQMTPGDLVAFFAALINVAQPLRGLVNVAGPLQQGIAAGDDIFGLLDQAVEPGGGKHEIRQVHGELEFRNVSFAYAGGHHNVLKNIQFRVSRGETVAIVGRSGSGKSTLASLLPRFYDPTAGEVLIDGIDIRQYRLEQLRECIAVVTQDVMLFDDTIRNNITFGRHASESDIEAAIAAAHVREFVQDLPAGLDTVVGDRGVLLSGGQRQRIAIARALLKNAPILILDEATSALDVESERIIQAALERLMQNRTTLVIAHRLSTVENADRIVVMDAGEIVEQGSHQQLLSQTGLYAQLHQKSFAE
jgi:ATP-binding cassette, subfamily B, bacterial MsbA